LPRIPATKYVGPNGAEIFRPIIVVTIQIGNGTARGPAIVDSGADDTIIPAEAVIPLGVDFSKLPLAPGASGAGGGFEVRMCDGIMRWEKVELLTRLKIAEPGKIDTVLLGRADFFQLYVPRFHWHKIPPCFDLDPVVRSK
jgi:hypothetical protein